MTLTECRQLDIDQEPSREAMIGAGRLPRETAVDHDMEHKPGDTAPMTGAYEQLNVFGTPTGKTVHVREGEPLPAAPRGHSWKIIVNLL